MPKNNENKEEMYRKGMKYCANCRQYVTPKKKFSWLGYVLSFFVIAGTLISALGPIDGARFGWTAIFAYPTWYYLREPICPICESMNWK